jgi:hypothetical protein
MKFHIFGILDKGCPSKWGSILCQVRDEAEETVDQPVSSVMDFKLRV